MEMPENKRTEKTYDLGRKVREADFGWILS